MGSETTSEPVLISLYPPSKEPNGPTPVQEFWRRVNEERGGILNITEETLKEEIQKNGHATSEVAEEDGGDQPQDTESRLKQLYQAKGEMLDAIKSAQDSILLTLDFVSLLMKRDRPQYAEQTMSPSLKQFLPVGTLGFDIIPNKESDQNKESDDEAVSFGWTLKSLSNVASRLAQAGNELEASVQSEKQYWDEIVSLKEDGWNVMRVPNEPAVHRVRFASLECKMILKPTRDFAQRGFAVLRPGSDGSIILDHAVIRNPKCLQIQIKQGDQTIASTTAHITTNVEYAPIKKQLRQARDSLFDEELYYFMLNESHGLLDCQILLENHEIVIPLNAAPTKSNAELDDQIQRVIITLITPSTHQISDSPDSEAHSILLALRLLLTKVHKRRYLRRIQPPAPISSSPESDTSDHILQPVAEYLRHAHATKTLEVFLDSTARAIRTAFSLQISTIASGPESPFTSILAASEDPSEALITTTTLSPWESSYRLTFPDLGTLEVSLATALDGPCFGTRHTLHIQVARRDSPLAPRHGQNPTTIYPAYKSDAMYADLERLLSRCIAAYLAHSLEQYTTTGGRNLGAGILLGREEVEGRRKGLRPVVKDGVLFLGGTWVDQRQGNMGQWTVWRAVRPPGRDLQKAVGEIVGALDRKAVGEADS